MDLWELWGILGPGFAGAMFAVGWWFWVDAVVCSSVKVSFLHYLPGVPLLSFSETPFLLFSVLPETCSSKLSLFFFIKNLRLCLLSQAYLRLWQL
uniref:Transmembrane protein 50a n=1 Tax=Rhizophora mucronata TaxID=61149 RepID=A0A2P2KJS3_RHIMU